MVFRAADFSMPGWWPTLTAFIFFLKKPRVPLDKSEGPVKEKLSLAMRKHRDVGQRS